MLRFCMIVIDAARFMANKDPEDSKMTIARCSVFRLFHRKSRVFARQLIEV